MLRFEKTNKKFGVEYMNTKEMVLKLLKENESEKTGGGLLLAMKMQGALKRLKRRLKKDRLDFVKRPKESMWIKENFPRLEQTMREDIGVVWRLRHIQRGKRFPRFFEVFNSLLSEDISQSRDELEDLFCLCNDDGKGLDYNDSLSLLVLFRSAAELSLCELFLLVFDDDYNNEDDKISKLFSLLDLLLSVSRERLLLCNKIEKTFLDENCGIYPTLSDKTKESYRRNLSKTARIRKLSQIDLAGEIVKKCNKNNEHIGTVLSDKAHGGLNYLMVLMFLTVSFAALLCLVSPVFLIFVIPIYYSTSLVLDKFFSKYFIEPFVLPQIKVEKVPDNCGVMTVVTTLLLNREENEKICEKLEKSYFSCGGKNVSFGILADLADSDESVEERDEQILENANYLIRKLREKYGDVFYFFVRQRVWSNSEERYIAPERKRGAVCSLASFLCGEDDDFSAFSIKPSLEKCKSIKYIVTLDADTNLGFDCIKELVGYALHPQNKPVFDEAKKCVTKGYGIFQPEVSTAIDSASKNYFTKIMCGHGGIDNYAFGGSNKNMSLYGQSFFCGKGLIEKNVFCEAFCKENVLKKERILSHDAVEGAILRCAFAQDVCFTDSYPSNTLSYFKRKHRWIRGDIQNIPFLFSKIDTADGQTRSSSHSIFSRFFMLQNVVNALVPVFCLIAIVTSLFCLEHTKALLITLALSNLILPFVNTVLAVPFFSLWQNVRRILYSKDLYTGIWTSFMQMLFSISALPKSAFVSFDASVRSIYRSVVSHKKMLEWTTFSQSDKEAEDGLLGFVKSNLVCAAFGAFVFLMTDNGILKITSLMWFCCPYFAYIYSESQNTAHKNDEKTKQKLIEYCGDMWKFFEENVSGDTCHLPPDNISFHNGIKPAGYTSPTNIGFYVLCLFVARKMGFIDSKQLEKRLLDTLSELQRIPKFNGLLYNWYDVKKAESLCPKYVSSVDIGNYLACLICAKNALLEFADEMKNAGIIEAHLERLIDVDITPLYDAERNLFYIGGTHKGDRLVLDKNHYDMLVSEARILSFIAIASKSVPVYHITCLSRPFAESNRHIGLASWSGTAFEYFLPEIFVKSKEGTLLYEANSFSYTCAKQSGADTRLGRVYGISESLYNQFDDVGGYKYFSFGTAKNALRVTDEKRIISPYSAFLFLPMSVKENMKNLENLSALGCYGKYGFYDSIDFENEGVVKCVMSHHIGMSMCAAANVVYEGVIREWFASDKRMNCALELLEEKIPYELRVKKISRKNYDISIPEPIIRERTEKAVRQNVPKQAEMLCAGESIYSTFYKLSLDKTILYGDETVARNEKLIFDEKFDLIKNSENVAVDNGIAAFTGSYNGEKYQVKMFCSAKESFKVILVKSKFAPCFVFDFDNNRNEEIGSGAVFIPQKNGIKYCFGIGMKTHECFGADYSVKENVTVHFEENIADPCEYVFCVGKCLVLDEISVIQSYVSNNLSHIIYESEQNNKALLSDFSKIPQPLKNALSSYGYDEKTEVLRYFTNTFDTDKAFLSVLLVFTEHCIDKKTVLERLKRWEEDWVLDLLSCLLFALYIDNGNDASVADKKMGSKTAYKVFLEKVFTLSKNQEKIKKHELLYKSSVQAFARCCERVGDIRMGQRVTELIND